MKILKLKLINFASIKNAMDANEVTIDFTNSKNRICLLIGNNGSGKTSILSQLTPFSDVGNLDVRNGQNLILKGKEGIKEITIKNNNDVYFIRHIYTPREDKSHSVKSYISRNGVELNENGNVTSFKEYVKDELFIESDYLKLIRLGSNVTSMIDLSETERKNFMSKVLDEVGIYLNYYKIVNDKLKRVKENISHTINKLDKLGVKDIEEINDLKAKHKSDASSYESMRNKLDNNIAVLKSEINKIDDLDNLSQNLKDTTRLFKKMQNIMDNKDNIESSDASFYTDKINSLNMQITHNDGEINLSNTMLHGLIDQIDASNTRIKELKIQENLELDKESEIDNMEKNLAVLRKELNSVDDIVKDFKPSISVDEFSNFKSFMESIQQRLYTTYEFGKKPIGKVIDLLRADKNVSHYINAHMMEIDDRVSNNNSVFLARLMTMYNFNTVINCPNECVAKSVFNDIKDLITNREVKSENNADFYINMDYASKNIANVLMDIASKKETINKLPKNIKDAFSSNKIYDAIKACKAIYSVKDYDEYLSMLMEYERKCKLESDIERTENEISKLTKASNLFSIHELIVNEEKNLKELNDSYDEYKNRLHDAEENNKELIKTRISYEDIKETLEKYDETKALYDKYSKDFMLYTSNTSEIKDLTVKRDAVYKLLSESNLDYNNMLLIEHDYNELNKELDMYSKIYDEMVFVKNALSSKEGIPLHYILNYLGNTVELTNDLLNSVYGGSKYIDDFEITPTTFSIPFFNNNIRLPDVKYASQGELSFLSIALSFALSSQTLSKYNIMLLDEIDGPLDTTNREKFIRILEKQIERIDSEQCFLITHNAMFSSYPIDIIDLTFGESNDYPLANYIEIERK